MLLISGLLVGVGDDSTNMGRGEGVIEAARQPVSSYLSYSRGESP